jgi:hypothetical protein
MSDDERGHASGHSVQEDEDGGFAWSAFGPAGTRQGHAETEAEAESAAHAAEEELKRGSPR